MSGGTVYISSSQAGADSAVDYDGSAAITGGTIIGVGQSSMAQNFGDDSTQGSIVLTVDAQTSPISLLDQDGNELAAWTPAKSYNSILISCPALQVGSTYTVVTGSEETEVTLDSLISGGNTGHMGGGMGGRGQRR